MLGAEQNIKPSTEPSFNLPEKKTREGRGIPRPAAALSQPFFVEGMSPERVSRDRGTYPIIHHLQAGPVWLEIEKIEVIRNFAVEANFQKKFDEFLHRAWFPDQSNPTPKAPTPDLSTILEAFKLYPGRFSGNDKMNLVTAWQWKTDAEYRDIVARGHSSIKGTDLGEGTFGFRVTRKTVFLVP